MKMKIVIIFFLQIIFLNQFFFSLDCEINQFCVPYFDYYKMIEPNLFYFKDILVLDEYKTIKDSHIENIFGDEDTDYLFFELYGKYGVGDKSYFSENKKDWFIVLQDHWSSKNLIYWLRIENDKLKKIPYYGELPNNLESVTNISLDNEINSLLVFNKIKFSLSEKELFVYQVPEIKECVYKCRDNESFLSSIIFNEKMNKIAFYSLEEGEDTICKVIEISLIYDGKIIDSRVRLRTDAGLSSETVDYLNNGDNVLIYDRSDFMTKINSEEWYWYKIETKDGKNGWVYGKYLDIE